MLWAWLKDRAPDDLPNMHVVNITWFTDSMRERRPVAVETRHRIQVGVPHETDWGEGEGGGGVVGGGLEVSRPLDVSAILQSCNFLFLPPGRRQTLTHLLKSHPPRTLLKA